MLPKAKDLNKKTDNELIKLLEDTKREILSGADEKPSKKRNLKKIIAKIKLVLSKRNVKL